MKHIMIDLETMGLRPDAAIISIGAVHFNATEVVSKFYTPVSLASCLAAGLTQDQSTVDWWAKQSPEARAAWQTEDAPSFEDAMIKFTGWVREVGPEREIAPWGNGPDFDLVILTSAYRALHAETPWRFYNHHCFRTMKNLFIVGAPPRAGTHHNALDDAMHQVAHLQTILNVHRIRL